MRCPFCEHESTKVVDKRDSENGVVTRRRRECLKCTERFTTYERIEAETMNVVKNDGTRQAFDREKILKEIIHTFRQYQYSKTTYRDENQRRHEAQQSIQIILY